MAEAACAPRCGAPAPWRRFYLSGSGKAHRPGRGQARPPRRFRARHRHVVLSREKLAPHHFRQASHIFVMDRQNLADVRALAPADCTAGISLLLDTLNDHKGREITDPYRGTQQDFARVWRQCAMAAREIAKQLPPGVL
jgi:protein-tyrosine phosphatase